MNEKKVKKLRQIYKRDYRKRILENTEILNDCMKKRPKYCPRKVWVFGMSIFFDLKKLDDKFTIK